MAYDDEKEDNLLEPGLAEELEDDDDDEDDGDEEVLEDDKEWGL